MEEGEALVGPVPGPLVPVIFRSHGCVLFPGSVHGTDDGCLSRQSVAPCYQGPPVPDGDCAVLAGEKQNGGGRKTVVEGFGLLQ